MLNDEIKNLRKDTKEAEKYFKKALAFTLGPVELKELAEKDFITKDEFLSRRLANIGGLLPLTRKAPGIGIDQPAPSPDLIIERLEILKEGVESRAITPREFSVERDIIIEALMSPNPRQRIKNKAPSKNVLDAANDLRRIEVLYNLNLITENERNAEQKAVEKYLGINRTQDKPKVVVKTEPVTTVEAPAPIQIVSTPKEAPQSAAVESEAINNSTPAVTSPF